MTDQEPSKGTTQGLEDLGYIEESTLMLRYKQNGVWFEARGTENILSKLNYLVINPMRIELTKARLDEQKKTRIERHAVPCRCKAQILYYDQDSNGERYMLHDERVEYLNAQLESHKQKGKKDE